MMRAGAIRGLDRDVLQLAVVNVLVTHARASAATVRDVASPRSWRTPTSLAAAMRCSRGSRTCLNRCGRRDRLRSNSAASKLHPGALAAYRDGGLAGLRCSLLQRDGGPLITRLHSAVSSAKNLTVSARAVAPHVERHGAQLVAHVFALEQSRPRRD